MLRKVGMSVTLNRNAIARESINILKDLTTPVDKGGFGLTDKEAEKLMTDILQETLTYEEIITKVLTKRALEEKKAMYNRILTLMKAGQMGGKKRHSKRSKKQRRRKTRRSTR